MPVPMTAPTPRLVSWTGPRTRRSRFSPAHLLQEQRERLAGEELIGHRSSEGWRLRRCGSPSPSPAVSLGALEDAVEAPGGEDRDRPYRDEHEDPAVERSWHSSLARPRPRPPAGAPRPRPGPAPPAPRAHRGDRDEQGRATPRGSRATRAGPRGSAPSPSPGSPSIGAHVAGHVLDAEADEDHDQVDRRDVLDHEPVDARDAHLRALVRLLEPRSMPKTQPKQMICTVAMMKIMKRAHPEVDGVQGHEPLAEVEDEEVADEGDHGEAWWRPCGPAQGLLEEGERRAGAWRETT